MVVSRASVKETALPCSTTTHHTATLPTDTANKKNGATAMYFFLLLSIPAAICCLISTDSEYSPKQLSAPIFVGFFTGILTSAFIEFFINSDIYFAGSFIAIVLSMSAKTIFPPILLTTFFFIFSKDDIEYKAYSTLPLIGAFYSIFIPYLTMTQGESNSFFMTFTNPVLFIETTILFSSAVIYGAKEFTDGNRKKVAKPAALGLAALMIQPVMFTLWYLKTASIIAYVLAFALIPTAIFVYKFSRKR